MGGNRTQTTTNTSTSAPTSWQQAQITGLYDQGNRALASTPRGPNATQTQAMDWLTAQAPGLSAGANEVRDLGVRTARGDFLSPDSNPFIRQAVEAARQPLERQLEQRSLQIGDAAQQAGAYGGSRQALLSGQALGEFNRDAMASADQIYFQNYNNERQLQQNAPALLSAANQLNLAPGQLLGMLGDQQYQWASEMPWNGIDRMAALLSLGQGYGTTSGTTTAPRAGGGAQGAASGALGGASAGSAFGPWGAGIGAVVGGLGGLFG